MRVSRRRGPPAHHLEQKLRRLFAIADATSAAPRLRVLSLIVVLVALSGCLPPKRSNEPLSALDADGSAGALDADDGSAQDTGSDTAAADTDVAEAGPTDDVVALPKGCTSDAACAPLAFGPCQDATCVKATGLCVVADKKNGTTCEDGDACSLDPVCKAGVCAGTLKNCDDGNPCTIDACDLAIGCTTTNSSVLCDDGKACTLDDRCKDGTCSGTARDCSTAETACATAQCNPATGECKAQPKSKGTPCDDGNACTKGDSCSGLECTGQKDCDDGKPCTEDLCPGSGEAGCLHLTLQGKAPGCTDGDPCIVALCLDGTCQKTAKDCDDDVDCTADSCGTDGSCVHEKLSAGSCDDGDPCTTGDQCLKGQCKSDQNLSCDDGNACTDEACIPFQGCKITANSKFCNDGSACTASDVCKNGKCSGTPKDCDDGEVCTKDECAALTGNCTHSSVQDGSLCIGGTCVSGACKKAGS
ncbi:MAG: hypothetical protein H6747_06900 [Deltaproteobacteria bacterium]|nr:hypothetical protein [Deltaproteobacteria bacterium]